MTQSKKPHGTDDKVRGKDPEHDSRAGSGGSSRSEATADAVDAGKVEAPKGIP